MKKDTNENRLRLNHQEQKLETLLLAGINSGALTPLTRADF
jgi:hypothetical protein